jgi:hypothetical protein
MMFDAEYFVEKAEECFRLAQLAKQPGDNGLQVAQNLEAMGHEFMSKAVEFETARQRNQRTN